MTNGQTSNFTPNSLNQYLQRTVPSVLDVLGAALPGVPVTVSAGSYAVLATRQGEAFFQQVPVDNATQSQAVTVRVAAEQNPAGAAIAATQQRPTLGRAKGRAERKGSWIDS